MNDPIVHAVVVLAGLPLGVMAAQIIHAAGESAVISFGRKPDSYTHALAVEARSDDEMNVTLSKAAERGIMAVPIHEPDAPYNGALLAIGFAPIERSKLKWLQHLPLIKSRLGSSVG